MSSKSKILLPLGVIYEALTRVRLALYRAGALHVERIERPVISVGNITVGGSGKTPLVAWLARAVAREDQRVCILTRGYGRIDARRRVVVSDGGRVLSDARTGGDEPRLLAEQLLRLAAVISDADRVAAARWAIANLDSQVFILDDGFQHLRLARDLNILTLDATDPFGGNQLLPAGRLREPVRELARADCIVITRAELTSDLKELCEEVRRLSNGRPVFVARTKIIGLKTLRPSASNVDEMSTMRNQRIGAFCALGNPQAFFTQLHAEGYDVGYTRAFRDHHIYTQHDLDTCGREASQRGARALITTAKDAVKLNALSSPLPCFVLEIELAFDEEAALLDLVRRAISLRS